MLFFSIGEPNCGLVLLRKLVEEMSRNPELDALHDRAQEAFEAKQHMHDALDEAKAECDRAYDVMQEAWRARTEARDEMNRLRAELDASSENYRQVWDEYARTRDSLNSQIDDLRAEADAEHQAMTECFDQASQEYEYGDRSMAPYYSQQGHEHKARRDEINAQVKALCQELKDAREEAQWRAPKTDSSAYHAAKDAFQRVKAAHEAAQAEFQRLKAQRDSLKAKFDELHKEHLRLQAEFKRRLEEVKAANARERERVLDQAGIHGFERRDAKIRKKRDGTTQVYHGGLGDGDGLGHGHTALDASGQVTYDRDAFEKHGSQNFTDNSGGVTIYDRRARPGHTPSGIEGGVKLRPNSSFRGEGKDWYRGKKPGVIGHSTQYYDDGVRVSSDTRDGVHEENVHWSDTRLPKGHPDAHKKPKD